MSEKKNAKKTLAPVKPGKRREEPKPATPVKASKPATPPAKLAPKGKRVEPSAPVKAAKPAAAVEKPTAYVVGDQTFPYGAACSVLWPEPHGLCQAEIIAPDDARIMDRPIPRLKRGAPVRVFYNAEGVWMDHGADQIRLAAVKAPKGKASKAAPVETPAKRKPAGKRAA